ncbi:MAG: DUF4093 domain-containing protein [Clostridia bacterium]|nr:DUF4093 domain-containing protein [Clostridia bacterium]
MIKLDCAVIVEGKYDKIKLSNIIDALIIETDGFGIFRDKEKQKLIKRLAQTKGILILTDSDSAGFKIRAFIGGSVPQDRVFHAYIPDIFGKERRKDEPSKEGKLGVEGVSADVIRQALQKAGVLFSENENPHRREITSADMYEYAVSGKPYSKTVRKILLKSLSLPERLSSGSLLKVLNTFITYDEFVEYASRAREQAQKTEEI